jgi:BirA family transcriptional regulator, biotin operon repressor / biotin---[acetyl-CoA-carboxylase] ligase
MNQNYIISERGIFLNTVSSTNDYIKNPEITNGSYVSSDQQTSGKGRGENKWDSLGEGNIFFSTKFLIIPKDISNLSLLPLFVCGAVFKTLSSYISENNNLIIKWPNDLYLNSKKISGILMESEINSENVLIVLGIGINLYSEKKTDYSYIYSHKPNDELRKKIIFQLINHLNEWINAFISGDIENRIDFLEKKSPMLGKIIQYDYDGKILNGIAKGYSKNGFLQINTGDNLIELYDTGRNFKILEGNL